MWGGALSLGGLDPGELGAASGSWALGSPPLLLSFSTRNKSNSHARPSATLHGPRQLACGSRRAFLGNAPGAG